MKAQTKLADGDWRESKFPVRPLADALLGLAVVLFAAGSALAQVSPAELRNPALKAAEQQYFPQLQRLQHAVGETRFPLPFVLTRYVGVDPARQDPLDTRGLEFVYFQERILLKTSGFYSAAFNAEQLTPNERASRTFQEVIVPILGLMAQEIPPEVRCEGIGFEIAYHVRAPLKNSDLEGREILAVVFAPADAFAFVNEPGREQRQAILNRSEIYLDGKPFGLALGQREALDLETLGKLGAWEAERTTSSAPAVAATLRQFKSKLRPAATDWPGPVHLTAGKEAVTGIISPAAPAATAEITASPADAERLQAQFQARLDALVREDGARFHLVDYAPPSIAVYHKQMVLQLTLRDSLPFDKGTSSIYRRAAQSFDLFLAPQLKALVPRLPADMPIDAIDFSILNREKDSAEAVEFICPLRSIRSFVEDEIASQDLINQSVVLVNSVRIHLDLELVE